MNKWPTVSLAELLHLERRKVTIQPDQLYQEIGIYCFGRGIFHKTPRTGMEVGDKDLFLMKEGDFILQVTFAWEGAIAVVSLAEDGMYGSTRYPTFRVKTAICEPKFLLQYFRTQEGISQIGRICPGSAGRNRVLSLKRINEIQIPLPPLSEQRRVVARIEELSAQIHEARTLRQQATSEADAIVAARMHQLFQFHDAATRVIDFAKVQGGFAFESGRYDENGSYQVLRIGNVRDGYLDLSRALVRWNPSGDARVLRYELKPDDLVISMTGTREKRDYGFIAKVPQGKRLLLNQRVGRFVVHREVDRDYLFHFLRSPFFRDRLFPSATGTANQANIGNGDIEKIQFAPPPLAEQSRIVAELDALQAEVDALKRLQAETTAELDALLPAILDRAFKGEL